MSELTPLMAQVLGVIVDCGPVDAEQIDYHLRCDARRLGPVLGGLENRGLIGRTYTQGHRRHGYVAYEEGCVAARSYFSEDDE